MLVTVTDQDHPEQSKTYELSRNNWRNAWACMSHGLVHMWFPAGVQVREGLRIVTSGRLWEVHT